MNERFDRAISLIDQENSGDPNRELHNGQAVPRELLYSQRVTAWVLRLEPNASEILRLAARSQHICRWKIPRTTYPEGRSGYLKWRNDLKRFHADLTSDILRKAGYEEAIASRVRALNLKQDLTGDPEAQTIEDALCLVFLEYQFRELSAKLAPDKVVNALRKSWNKMSERARRSALQLPFTPDQKALLDRALATDQGFS